MKKLLTALVLVLFPTLVLAEPIRQRGSLQVRERSLIEDFNMFQIRNQANVVVFNIDHDGNVTFSGTCVDCGGGGGVPDPLTVGTLTVTTSGTINVLATNIIREQAAGGSTFDFQDSTGTSFLTLNKSGASAIYNLGAGGAHSFQANSVQLLNIFAAGTAATIRFDGDPNTFITGDSTVGLTYAAGAGFSHTFTVGATTALTLTDTSLTVPGSVSLGTDLLGPTLFDIIAGNSGGTVRLSSPGTTFAQFNVNGLGLFAPYRIFPSDAGATITFTDNILNVMAEIVDLGATGKVRTSILESTVATGTAPLVVASTTAVANLAITSAGIPDPFAPTGQDWLWNNSATGLNAGIFFADDRIISMSSGTNAGGGLGDSTVYLEGGAAPDAFLAAVTSGGLSASVRFRPAEAVNAAEYAVPVGKFHNFLGAITGNSTIQGTRLISTVATGTSPFVVASTTLVANLNADLLDGLDSTAFALAGAGGDVSGPAASVDGQIVTFSGTTGKVITNANSGATLISSTLNFPGSWGLQRAGVTNWSCNTSNCSSPNLLPLKATGAFAADGLSTLTGGLTTPALITSTLATGTAPFVVASTTLNTNLNADLLDGLSSAAFVQTSGAAVVSTLTVGGGQTVTKILSNTATLDFPSTLAGTVADLTITVTGALDGDTVALGVPSGSVAATSTFFGWVSAADTVTVRHAPNGVTADPAGGVFRATITQF